ncbi:hypothetical protein AAL_06980 [Moelleriella libera RCEF 2490]|uniref:Proteophosphoglycan 5 n=1 Tax=Moelleriella libera RCEF 2490 TaxID=1081109 RepID=A0A167Y1Q9_9HYPO|nr:hypothetical protein AAL_06980 [Moelleriella libera RCEF 2490]
MSDASPQQATTPARRRQGRQNTKSGAQKAYASENDAATLEASRQRKTPTTPHRTQNGTATNSDIYQHQLSNSRSKPRSMPKSRAGLVSPEPIPVGGQTPPLRSFSMKPGIGAAFAGATFHASPAPSALPIPSFLAKASSESPVSGSKGCASPLLSHEINTPLRPSSAPKTNESPLDFMFRAHREEKERSSRETTSEQLQGSGDSPHSLPHIRAHSNDVSARLRHSAEVVTGHKLGGLDALELNGTSRQPVGPAFSTPYQERIKAARSTASAKTNHPQARPSENDDSHMAQNFDSADALKKFLFGDVTQPNDRSGTVDSVTRARLQRTTTPATNLSSARAIASIDQCPDNIEAMERNLRRILKLDVGPDSAVTDSEFLPR